MGRFVVIIIIRVIVISFVCLSVCALFCPYNSKTITSIELKFSGQVFHGVQTNSSKFGVICLKIKGSREFFLFLIGHIQSNLIPKNHEFTEVPFSMYF